MFHCIHCPYQGKLNNLKVESAESDPCSLFCPVCTEGRGSRKMAPVFGLATAASSLCHLLSFVFVIFVINSTIAFNDCVSAALSYD